MTTPNHPQSHPLRRHLLTVIKVLIAVVGIWLVARMFTWDDSATILAGTDIRAVKFVKDVPVTVLQEKNLVPDPLLAVKPHPTAVIRFPETPVEVEIDGKTYSLRIDENTPIPNSRELLNVAHEAELPLTYFKEEKGERIHHGFHTLLLEARARWYLLVAAWAILVIPFFVTAIRWRNLLRPQGIDMPLGAALRLTFVGQFYSIILPGITGGDLVKIIYASKFTGSKTKSLITILLDRVIGLVALMTIAGTAAAVQLVLNARLGAPLDPTLLRVLLFILAGLVTLSLGSLVYFSHRLRRATGLAKILAHPRMPDFVRHIDETLHAYRRHFGTLAWAFLISLASQFTLPLSASLAGAAFGMHLPLSYYLAYVPVAILAASLPISPPQGFGLLDWIIIHFFVERGTATAAQAFALAQSVRFLPILWNLVGAYWIIRGTHSRHEQTPASSPTAPDPAPLTSNALPPA